MGVPEQQSTGSASPARWKSYWLQHFTCASLGHPAAINCKVIELSVRSSVRPRRHLHGMRATVATIMLSVLAVFSISNFSAAVPSFAIPSSCPAEIADRWWQLPRSQSARRHQCQAMVYRSTLFSAGGTASPPIAATGSEGKTEQELAAELLAEIKGTERGILASEEKRLRVSGLVEVLEAMQQDKDQLADPRFYRNCEVVYVGQSQSSGSNAAGGQFRGRIGRMLFRLTNLFQHVLRESDKTIAVNMIQFKLFGILPGAVVLKGSVTAEDASSRASLGEKWNVTLGAGTVLAQFDSPRVVLLGGRLLNLVVGPSSDVRLDTTYNGEQIRISRGGRSRTPFVFRADGPALEACADAWRGYEALPSVTARGQGLRFFGAAFVLGLVAAQHELLFGSGPARVLFGMPAVLLALLGAGLLKSNGGIVVNMKTTEKGSSLS
ncbi:unnamed protein product [Polarella glacialis]|uniref:Plastid lipid-associated protein/fibrillin conserved domain-containing protein n=2 Tax=Polarella glacialis TaxID=89957 RepID=A0A813LJ07_POLGL|nr:unnamed protein product [Polarella glacialis]|mmetsp:Transcript_30846/g.55201  ORF Transcript_30846/g.55201 Transcript_30846/m.55201 type:complete len:437 (+) Transcript_30846:152-1462(+)